MGGTEEECRRHQQNGSISNIIVNIIMYGVDEEVNILVSRYITRTSIDYLISIFRN